MRRSRIATADPARSQDQHNRDDKRHHSGEEPAKGRSARLGRIAIGPARRHYPVRVKGKLLDNLYEWQSAESSEARTRLSPFVESLLESDLLDHSERLNSQSGVGVFRDGRAKALVRDWKDALIACKCRRLSGKSASFHWVFGGWRSTDGSPSTRSLRMQPSSGFLSFGNHDVSKQRTTPTRLESSNFSLCGAILFRFSLDLGSKPSRHRSCTPPPHFSQIVGHREK